MTANAGTAGIPGAPGTAVLTLLNQGRGPAASAEVCRTREQSQAPESLPGGRWEVPTLALDPQTALGYLLAADDAETDVERPFAGADLRALRALAGFGRLGPLYAVLAEPSD